MTRAAGLLIASALAACIPAAAADLPVARLFVKPLLCVIDGETTTCSMTFNIRWKSETAAELCLNDSAQKVPLRCWPSVISGTHTQTREVGEPFVYWLGSPDGAHRAAEIKIEVLRLDSADRRRDRRMRHVWDVL